MTQFIVSLLYMASLAMFLYSNKEIVMYPYTM